MYHSINRRGCKNLVRQRIQHICDQNSLIRQHSLCSQSHFYALAYTVDNRNIGNLASGSAGCRDNGQRMNLFQLCHMIIEIIYLILRTSNCNCLGDINYCSTANCNNPVIFLLPQIIQDGIYHAIRRFSASVFLTEKSLYAQGQGRNILVKGMLTAKDKILLSQFRKLCIFLKGAVFFYFRFDRKSLHCLLRSPFIPAV